MSDELPAGTELGRYIIQGVIGRGGTGVVYAARDPDLDRLVALKLLHPSIDPAVLAREAQALAKLDDPRVVAVYDTGDVDGQAFIVMKLVDGEDLATALVTRKPEPAQVIAWFVAAGHGLAAAHAAGLIHRDFKPSNVLIDKGGRVAVTDFGLARSRGQLRTSASGQMSGTPAYMAPEQHTLEPATEASDQFAFCVALWQALFAAHPYVAEPLESLSPFAIGYAIYDGPLLPAPRGIVSREIVDALTRGLSRDPASRWPAMPPLLAVLAPAPRRRVWPFVIAGLAAAAAGGIAVWAIAGSRETPPSCATIAHERVATAWSAAIGQQVVDRFARSGRSYAPIAAAYVTSALDRYATGWSELAADTCDVESDLVLRRRACLDGRLDALRIVAELFTQAHPEFVDGAQAMIASLPELGDCADTASLPGALPPELAGPVTALERELDAAVARGRGGEIESARTQLVSIAARADALKWPPLAARAHLELGSLELRMNSRARPELLLAGELATANHLDRIAARAWTFAVWAAGVDRAPDAVDVQLSIAHAAVELVGDPGLKILLDVSHGRALAQLDKWTEAVALCRGALAAARASPAGFEVAADAQSCLVEALLPMGAYAELATLVDELIAEHTKRDGAEHPNVAEMLGVRAFIDRVRGDLPRARDEALHALAIRRRSYAPRDSKIAKSLRDLGSIALANSKPAEAKPYYEEALAIGLESLPAQLILVNEVEMGLAEIAIGEHDRAGAFAHFDQAVARTRKLVGPDAVELGVILGTYGQEKYAESREAGLAMIAQAHDILERAHDRRAPQASAVFARRLLGDQRYAEARPLLEAVIGQIDGAVEPALAGRIEYWLAWAIDGMHGDRKRARELATAALAHLKTAGPQMRPLVEEITKWLPSLK